MLNSSTIRRLPRDRPGSPALADALRAQQQILASRTARLKGASIDDVHQVRVAARRLRSLLRTFRPLLDPRRVRLYRADLRTCARALADVRESDVRQQLLLALVQRDAAMPRAGFRRLSGQLEATGDAARGAKLAYTCHGCHGIANYRNAYPVYNVPRLGGQHAAYLAVALEAYASQERAHPTMHAQAATLSEQDIQDIAAYLSGKELEPGAKPVGAAPKASQTCVACHGNDGIGILPEYPNLAGQHADYLANSLKGYRSGQRRNAVMGGMAATLSDQDIAELAEYYASQRPGLCSTDEIRNGGKCQAR